MCQINMNLMFDNNTNIDLPLITHVLQAEVKEQVVVALQVTGRSISFKLSWKKESM